MITIRAKKKGKGVKVAITLAGPGKDVADETAAIVLQLPKRLIEIDSAIFKRFASSVKSSFDSIVDEDEEVDDNAEPVEG